MNVQMNVRIDDGLKAEGDAVFASLGLSPTQVVRSVWKFAVEHKEEPAIVRASLESDVHTFKQLEKERALDDIRDAADAIANFRDALGLPHPDALEELDYRAMRKQAHYDRMTERGLA